MKALARNVPVFYGVHACNAVLLAHAFRDAAPALLTGAPLLLLLVGYGLRVVTALSTARRPMTPEIADRHYRRLHVLTALLILSSCLWSFALSQYGTAALQMHGLIYQALSILLCAISLMHIRSVSLIAISALLPVGAIALATGESTMRITALTVMITGLAVFYLIVLYSRSFRDLVNQHGELKRLSGETALLAKLDQLTGLPNRNAFFAELQALLGAAGENGEIHVAVIDLDGFKTVNEMYGHAVGDGVLREVALRLRGLHGPGRHLGRLGGDEFGLVISGGESADEAQGICHAVLAAIREPVLLDAHTVRVDASIGLASATAAGGNAAQLHEQVHYALRQAKSGEVKGCVRFSRDVEDRMRRANQLAHALRSADLQSELSLQFQPVVDATHGRIIAFEALARWTSPEIGPVSPAEFITVAENSGLIGLMTDVLLLKALQAAATWPADIQLFFNLSARDIVVPGFAERIAEIIAASGLAPRRVAFEVTETALVRDFAAARQTLRALKELGVSIALDDFGTGFSSLSYVHRLPIDKLKIDQSFVSEITTSRTCRDIVRAVIAMCRSLGIATVAEGVETREQMLLLGRLGCRTMQGYHFGKPLPVAEAERLALRPDLLGLEGALAAPASAA
ncbi:putative bifunctional diguanylate cyclase/phosphodiesterase [Methylobacterium nigriterrae]|uniref:putative bifunctional diguanylate cyclase/phosphodiesterase n=1 Tax=Methylobacterium nigriterrae TaxID=3127512 RepID=UPI003013A17C